MTTYSTKYFPFCPRIPWKIKNGIYVMPELSGVSWEKANEDRKPIVVCHGGLFEAFASLAFLEMYNFISPATPMQWSGSERFYPLLAANKLARPHPHVDAVTLQRFPLPVFMDRQEGLYYNCLYNYLEAKPYYGGKAKKRWEPVLKQLLNNMTQPWLPDYLPKIRDWRSTTATLEPWIRTTKFQPKLPYICIFMDRGFSMHSKVTTLKWTDMEVKSLAAMLKPLGIQTVVITNSSGKYYNSKAIVMKPDLMTGLFLLQNAMMVLSSEVDWLLVAGMLSNAKVVQGYADKRMDVSRNMSIIGRTCDITVSGSFRPIEVFKFLEQRNVYSIANDRNV